jgi:hypothetical protein
LSRVDERHHATVEDASFDAHHVRLGPSLLQLHPKCRTPGARSGSRAVHDRCVAFKDRPFLGAGHTAGLATHPAEWEARVTAFLDRGLGS